MKLFVTDKWKIIRYTSVVLAICFVFTIANNMSWDVLATLASGKLLPIYNIQTEEKCLSLTFDCAWGAEDMTDILDTLKSEDVKATFFVLGQWAEKYPDVIKQMVADGHDVSNHSDTHPHISQLSYDKIKTEITNANTKIESITGIKNNLFRAPYGEYNDNVIKAADELGFYTIQWDVDSLDWKNPGQEAIINRVVTKVAPGSIILLHNGTQDTAKALPKLIQKLKTDGYTFKPISEFIYKENYIIDHAGKQIKN